MLSMGGPLVQARNFAVMTGVNAGVSAAMKRWRGGRDDLQNQLAGEWRRRPWPKRSPVLAVLAPGVRNAPAHCIHRSSAANMRPPSQQLARSLGGIPSPPALLLRLTQLPPAPPPPSRAAAFCSGASFSLVSGGINNPAAVPGAAPPNPLMAAFSAGVVFALFQGGFYKASLPAACAGG
jgi:hypothetical protein